MTTAEYQQFLIDHGYDLGPSGADGVNGPRTKAAVRAWQRDHGLVEDGVVGPKTVASFQGAAPTAATPGAPAANTPAKAGQDYADFGSFAWAMSDPEVAQVLTQAKNENWPEAKTTAALQATNWWRTSEDSVRQWNALIAANPSEAADRAATQFRNIQALAQQFGIDVPEGVAKSWADSALRYSWTQQQLVDTMLTTWTYHPDTAAKGKSGSTIQELNKTIADYGVPISDATKNDWLHQVLQGAVTVESFKSYLANIAAADNPWMKSALDQGYTVKQVMDPYITRAAEELGISPAEIDLAQPKWRRLIEFTDDKGERVRPNSQQIAHLIRTDATYGWDATDGANTQAAQFASELSRLMGATG